MKIRTWRPHANKTHTRRESSSSTMSPASSAASSSGARRPVTRLSQHFGQMMTECPHDIQVYGACVANITGGVNRSACEAEFEKLKQCFTRVAKKAGGRR